MSFGMWNVPTTFPEMGRMSLDDFEVFPRARAPRRTQHMATFDDDEFFSNPFLMVHDPVTQRMPDSGDRWRLGSPRRYGSPNQQQNRNSTSDMETNDSYSLNNKAYDSRKPDFHRPIYRHELKPGCHCDDCRMKKHVDYFNLSPRVSRRPADDVGLYENYNPPRKNRYSSSPNERYQAPRSIPVKIQAAGTHERSPLQNRREVGSRTSPLSGNLSPTSPTSNPRSPSPLQHSRGSYSPTSTSPSVTTRLHLNGAKLSSSSNDITMDEDERIEKLLRESKRLSMNLENASAAMRVNNPPEVSVEDTNEPGKTDENVTTETNDALKQKLDAIENVRKEVETLSEKVDSFVDSAKTKDYLYFEEMLTKCLLKLDNILTEGMDEVRKARRIVVNEINERLKQLEEKVSQDKNERSLGNEPSESPVTDDLK